MCAPMQTDIITCLIAYLSMGPCSHRLTFEPRCRSTLNKPKWWWYIFDNPVYIRLSVKSSYEIASLFHMYKDMGEGIPGEQDTLSLITECPSQGPSNSQKYTFKKTTIVFPYVCMYMSPLWWNMHLLTFWCPGTLDFMYPPPPPPPPPRTPKK